MTENLPSRSSRHEQEGAATPAKKRRTWLWVLIAVLVVAAVGVAAFFLLGNKSKVAGLPASVPVANGEISNVIQGDSLVSFSVDVADAAAQEAVLKQFETAGYTKVGSSEAEGRSTYAFSKGDMNVTVVLSTEDGVHRVIYAAAGPGVGKGTAVIDDVQPQPTTPQSE